MGNIHVVFVHTVWLILWLIWMIVISIYHIHTLYVYSHPEASFGIGHLRLLLNPSDIT